MQYMPHVHTVYDVNPVLSQLTFCHPNIFFYLQMLIFWYPSIYIYVLLQYHILRFYSFAAFFWLRFQWKEKAKWNRLENKIIRFHSSCLNYYVGGTLSTFRKKKPLQSPWKHFYIDIKNINGEKKICKEINLVSCS